MDRNILLACVNVYAENSGKITLNYCRKWEVFVNGLSTDLKAMKLTENFIYLPFGMLTLQ